MTIIYDAGAPSVTPDTIATALGRTAPTFGTPEYEQWSMWINDALMLIAARLVGTQPGQVATLDDLDQDKLAYVVREAVVAQVRRPDDATQVAIAVDDGNVSRTYRSSAGRVTIRDEWWDLLSPTDSEAGKAFSVDTTPVVANGHAWWCATTFGADWCSCGAVIGQQPMFEVIDSNAL